MSAAWRSAFCSKSGLRLYSDVSDDLPAYRTRTSSLANVLASFRAPAAWEGSNIGWLVSDAATDEETKTALTSLATFFSSDDKILRLHF